MTQSMNKIRVALDLGNMTDADLLKLVLSIAMLAPSSALITIASIQACVAAIAAKAAAFKAACDAVSTTEDTLRKQRSVRDAARFTLKTEVGTLASLASNNATSQADLTGIALQARGAAPAPQSLPDAPASIDVVMPKTARGKVKVSAHETGKPRGRYAAQWSPDPVTATSWGPLTGNGKSRTLAGASGTRIWVRFARVRGQVQSDWSTPVLVTLP